MILHKENKTMTNNQVDKCPYCESTNLGIGYQFGQGSIAPSKMGFSGCKIIHIVCRNCGSIVQSKVEKPSMFKEDKR